MILSPNLALSCSTNVGPAMIKSTVKKFQPISGGARPRSPTNRTPHHRLRRQDRLTRLQRPSPAAADAPATCPAASRSAPNPGRRASTRTQNPPSTRRKKPRCRQTKSAPSGGPFGARPPRFVATGSFATPSRPPPRPRASAAWSSLIPSSRSRSKATLESLSAGAAEFELRRDHWRRAAASCVALPNTTAQGKKNATSTSKMMNNKATT